MKTVTSIVYTSDLKNILTKFYKDWMKTVTAIVYTSDLINILTKFHKDWMKTVTSTVYTNKLLTINILTKFHKDWMKTATSIVYTRFGPRDQVFDPTISNVELCLDINKKYSLVKYHHYWTKTIASSVFTRQTSWSSFIYIKLKFWTRNVASFTRKTAPTTGGHVFERTGTTYELNQHTIKTNILTNFELYRGIIGTNLLTKFHEDRIRNVASRVFTN
ncbi:hypothetical protein DPMN_009638 [Dreissena polymorpha]|uniref:Uncharacterized protein n=1 Tax=Dreissena polymorpha TaxID=45954 RepID=A0A9D4S0A9_DREPO|nr:hypothetical protein DPMN_009638 [Dreissena polymorpha]